MKFLISSFVVGFLSLGLSGCGDNPKYTKFAEELCLKDGGNYISYQTFVFVNGIYTCYKDDVEISTYWEDSLRSRARAYKITK